MDAVDLLLRAVDHPPRAVTQWRSRDRWDGSHLITCGFRSERSRVLVARSRPFTARSNAVDAVAVPWIGYPII